MHRYLLVHEHTADECAVVFASWRGVDSPLRHTSAISTCEFDGHAIWWEVEARSEAEALGMLPSYVAARSIATRISEVQIP
jgi:hypothetical protein